MPAAPWFYLINSYEIWYTNSCRSPGCIKTKVQQSDQPDVIWSEICRITWQLYEYIHMVSHLYFTAGWFELICQAHTLSVLTGCYTNHLPALSHTLINAHTLGPVEPVWWEMYLSIIHLSGTKEVSGAVSGLLVFLPAWVGVPECLPASLPARGRRNGWL